MQRPRYPLRIDWITLALVFVISLILWWIPVLHDLLIIAAITVILYTFVKSLY
jgi:hypothetical protein